MKDQCWGRLIDARCRRRTLSVIPAPIHFSRILSDRHAQQWSKRGVNRIPNNHLLTIEQGYIGYIHRPHLLRTRCVPTMRRILQSSRGLALVCFSMSHSSAAYLSMFWRIFGGRTGEAGKRQPDNFQGLKAGRWVKDFLSGIFHHISICLVPVGHISQAEGSQQKRFDCGWPAGVLWRSLPRCSQQ